VENLRQELIERLEVEEELQAYLDETRRNYQARHPEEHDVVCFWISRGTTCYIGPRIVKPRQEKLKIGGKA
jgi:hypothetical protein